MLVQICRLMRVLILGLELIAMGDGQGPVLSWKELQKSTDTEVIEQLASGNHDALAVLVDRYQRLVLSVALRIVKDSSEAQDVVQAVFLEIFRNPAQFDPRRGKLKVWLLQFAYSRSLNRRAYLERRSFYSKVELESEESEQAVCFAPNRLSAGESARLIRQAVGALDAKQQRAIDLVYFEGLTLEEAARQAGETPAAMRHHYYRGLARLREFVLSRKTADERSLNAGKAMDAPVRAM
jgi:RNA polymerase sigma-70 factor (ECF subfamily)